MLVKIKSVSIYAVKYITKFIEITVITYIYLKSCD